MHRYSYNDQHLSKRTVCVRSNHGNNASIRKYTQDSVARHATLVGSHTFTEPWFVVGIWNWPVLKSFCCHQTKNRNFATASSVANYVMPQCRSIAIETAKNTIYDVIIHIRHYTSYTYQRNSNVYPSVADSSIRRIVIVDCHLRQRCTGSLFPQTFTTIYFFIFSRRIRSHIIQRDVFPPLLITNMNDKRLTTCSVRTP